LKATAIPGFSKYLGLFVEEKQVWVVKNTNKKQVSGLEKRYRWKFPSCTYTSAGTENVKKYQRKINITKFEKPQAKN